MSPTSQSCRRATDASVASTVSSIAVQKRRRVTTDDRDSGVVVGVDDGRLLLPRAVDAHSRRPARRSRCIARSNSARGRLAVVPRDAEHVRVLVVRLRLRCWQRERPLVLREPRPGNAAARGAGRAASSAPAACPSARRSRATARATARRSRRHRAPPPAHVTPGRPARPRGTRSPRSCRRPRPRRPRRLGHTRRRRAASHQPRHDDRPQRLHGPGQPGRGQQPLDGRCLGRGRRRSRRPPSRPPPPTRRPSRQPPHRATPYRADHASRPPPPAVTATTAPTRRRPCATTSRARSAAGPARSASRSSSVAKTVERAADDVRFARQREQWRRRLARPPDRSSHGAGRPAPTGVVRHSGRAPLCSSRQSAANRRSAAGSDGGSRGSSHRPGPICCGGTTLSSAARPARGSGQRSRRRSASR